MDITEIKIFLKEGQDKKLKAYATITFDGMFVVRNVKIIDGTKGLFVAMPSRKLKEPCPKCRFRNTVRSKFCNQCGAALPMTDHKAPVSASDDAARQSEHKDIAHPITAECRDYIQRKVLEAYEKEVKSPTPTAPAHAPAQTQAPAPRPGARIPAPAAPTAPSPAPFPIDDDIDIEL